MRQPVGIASIACPYSGARQYYAAVEHEITAVPTTIRVLVRYAHADVLKALRAALERNRQ